MSDLSEQQQIEIVALAIREGIPREEVLALFGIDPRRRAGEAPSTEQARAIVYRLRTYGIVVAKMGP